MVFKLIYKILRSFVFSATLVVVGLYVLCYTIFSIPFFTNIIKDRTAYELSVLIGGKVNIGDIDIYPFNEIQVKNLEVYDLNNEKCLEVETIGAGIRLWKLIFEGKIELTYGEIIGLNALITQKEKDSPLNIDFIIKAFSSKEENKEKHPFEFSLHNVVLRKSAVSFHRPWLEGKKIGDIDLSDLNISELAADITFPKISDKGVTADLRRMSFNFANRLKVEKIGLKGEFGEDGFFIEDFVFRLPESIISIPLIDINLGEDKNFITALRRDFHELEIVDSYITPKDFSFLWAPLENFNEPLDLELKAGGKLDAIKFDKFELGNPAIFQLSFAGGIENLPDIQRLKGDISELSVFISEYTFQKLSHSITAIPPQLKNMIQEIGDLKLNGVFSGGLENTSLKGNLDLLSDAFSISLEGEVQKNSLDIFQAQGEINIENLHLQKLLPSVPINNVNANIVAEGGVSKMFQEGMVSLVVEDFEYKRKHFEGFSVNLSLKDKIFEGDVLVNNTIADFNAQFSGNMQSEKKMAKLNARIDNLDLSELIDMKSYDGYLVSGDLSLDGEGSKINDIIGDLSLNNFSFSSPDNSKSLDLKKLTITADDIEGVHTLNLNSDWLDAHIEGIIDPKDIIAEVLKLGESVCPAFVKQKIFKEELTSNLDFDIIIKNNNSVPEFFNLPFRFLVPVSITGNLVSENNTGSLIVDVPYLQQGKDKLIYDSKLKVNIDGDSGVLDALIETTMPVKKGDLNLNLTLYGQNNSLSTDIRWINTENSSFRGHVVLDTEVSKNQLSHKPEININIKPSLLHMGTEDWNISPALISYCDKNVKVNNLKIWNDSQFVEIEGTASPDYEDIMRVSLADINVDYVFDMLQINYVTFGGSATGEVAGHSLLSSDPVAETESFKITNFSYNGSELGDCIVTSRWNNDQKEIEITADIGRNGKRNVYAYGGIWLGKDSLCFNIDADKVPVDFVQPFMAVFSSHVGGFASGDVKLFGTFRDIDMTGKIFADSVAIKLDYTNTIYHGSDSVFMNPGKIEIPNFKLYDKFGNSALVTGELTHRYFHDPSFNFRLSDAQDFLCYDTSAEINPDWYGTLFGTGSANLVGIPGLVDISADMTITGNSSFTFVLNETQYAQDYQFLTFSDKRGEEEKKKNATLTVDDFKDMLKKKMTEEGSLSRFGIDIRATVTPQSLFTLVMDPKAGDKITARGRGAMQVKYESDNDEMTMYGKYEIAEGNYNFSLQDIILRDFKIKEGSYISFNGNPLAADLDISATYRVNTNLSDLDKSFSTDRDLNRTNVPVDAVLSVEGNMQNPDITFDIELPTLTQDVERKVKSIISTDDMMNRQIIYLLALNRFYTPEYMGASGNGGELAAVASSTISSQLTNILGQLTDKFSVSPSIRSDKGDFSDIEVDVALSSRLLNNRLLINGNFGYRDRSNSSTTFVGDFDVEYLLSRNGNLRLKAYNHFNDQNYYLREALTTQGLGVVYRRDFDDWFTFLKKRNKKKEEENKTTTDKENTETNENLTNGTEN